MAKLTQKMQTELYSLQCSAATLDVRVARFVRMTIKGLYETAWEFDRRADLQSYIDTLRMLVDTWVHQR